MTNLLGPRCCGEAGMFPVILAYRYSAGQNLLTKIQCEYWQQHFEDICLSQSILFFTSRSITVNVFWYSAIKSAGAVR